MTFHDLFVATAWDLYFVFGREDNYYHNPQKLNEDIIMYLGRFITNQGYEIPNLLSLAKDLSKIDIGLENFTYCEQKDEFVRKYSALLQENLTKINNK